MDRSNQLQPIESEAEVRRLQVLTDDVIENPNDFKSEWLCDRRWTVVPIDSADHFTETDTSLLAAAFFEAGHCECFAVATEPLTNTPLCYKVRTTKEGLAEFNSVVWAFQFILIPEDRSCAVLCTKDNYYLVGGSLAFVRTAVGGDIAKARAGFLAFTERETIPLLREGLRGIAKRYE